MPYVLKGDYKLIYQNYEKNNRISSFNGCHVSSN